MPLYTTSELKDLLMLTLQNYEEDLKKETLTKEETVAINDWVMKNSEQILEYHNDYLTVMSLESNKHNDWEYGDIGGY
tara:strand:+ start:1223 stop:1456 length:234 start_codon:yes stop_codon:yes gene_type:complete